MRETEEDINRRHLKNHEVVKKGCYIKRRVLCGPLSSHFEKLLEMMELSGIIARCAILLSRSKLQETMKGVIKNTKKNLQHTEPCPSWTF